MQTTNNQPMTFERKTRSPRLSQSTQKEDGATLKAKTLIQTDLIWQQRKLVINDYCKASVATH